MCYLICAIKIKLKFQLSDRVGLQLVCQTPVNDTLCCFFRFFFVSTNLTVYQFYEMFG